MSILGIDDRGEGSCLLFTAGGPIELPTPEPFASVVEWASRQTGMNRGRARAVALAVAAGLTSGKGRVKAPPIDLLDEAPDHPEHWDNLIRLCVMFPPGSPALAVIERARRPMRPVPSKVERVRPGELIWLPETTRQTASHNETELPHDLLAWCANLDRRGSIGPVGLDPDARWIAWFAWNSWAQEALTRDLNHQACFELLMNVAGVLAMFLAPDRPLIASREIAIALQMVVHHNTNIAAELSGLENLEEELSKVVPIRTEQPAVIRPPWER